MSRDSCLPPQRDMLADVCRSGHSDQTGEHAVRADGGAVADENEVAELGPGCDSSFAEGCAVDRTVGADLDIVVDHGSANLRDFYPFLVDRRIAQAILPDDGTGVNRDATSDDGLVVDHDVGEQDTIVSEDRASPNEAAGVQHTAITDRDIGGNRGPRRDTRISADPRRRIDLGVFASPPRGMLAIAVQLDDRQSDAGIRV